MPPPPTLVTTLALGSDSLKSQAHAFRSILFDLEDTARNRRTGHERHLEDYNNFMHQTTEWRDHVKTEDRWDTQTTCAAIAWGKKRMALLESVHKLAANIVGQLESQGGGDTQTDGSRSAEEKEQTFEEDWLEDFRLIVQSADVELWGHDAWIRDLRARSSSLFLWIQRVFTWQW